MSIASIGSSVVLPQSAKLASDGDPAAVEARETGPEKRTEQRNGGITPKAGAAEASASIALTATAATGTTGILNRIA